MNATVNASPSRLEVPFKWKNLINDLPMAQFIQDGSCIEPPLFNNFDLKINALNGTVVLARASLEGTLSDEEDLASNALQSCILANERYNAFIVLSNSASTDIRRRADRHSCQHPCSRQAFKAKKYANTDKRLRPCTTRTKSQTASTTPMADQSWREDQAPLPASLSCPGSQPLRLAIFRPSRSMALTYRP